MPVLDGDEAAYWHAFEVNVRGTYWLAKAFLPLLLGCGGDKTFVAISSMGAHICTPGASAYQTSKFAVVRFAEFLMADYGKEVSLLGRESTCCLSMGGKKTWLERAETGC